MVGSDFCPDSNGLFLEMNLETGCWKLVVNCTALTKAKIIYFFFFHCQKRKLTLNNGESCCIEALTDYVLYKVLAELFKL